MQGILDAAVKQYYERFPLEGDYANLDTDAEMFMGELLELMDREKTYKSMLKKGYPAVIMYKKDENSPYEEIIGLQSEQAAKKYIERNKLTKYKLYMIDDALSGKIDYIAVKCLAKFNRDLEATINVLRQLVAKGVGVFMMNEDLDTLRQPPIIHVALIEMLERAVKHK